MLPTTGGLLNDRICVAVTNFDFSENADALFSGFDPLLHAVLIDASSPTPPRQPHISIPNSYYPGLWNAAVGYALDHGYEWLMFVASDVKIGNVERLCRLADEAISYENIGIYTPSLTWDSRSAYEQVSNHKTSHIRECGLCEGFFFLARVEILRKHYPIGPENSFGWNVDMMCAQEAYAQGKVVAVDDRITIFHPAPQDKHRIDLERACEEGTRAAGAETAAWATAMSAGLAGKFKPVSVTTSLDLGCGPTPRNNFGSKTVHGVDIESFDNPLIVRGDLNIEPIPFPDNTFEYVTASDFIEHICRVLYAPRRRYPFVELMNEVYRVLRPGGIFLSVTPAYPDAAALQDPTHVNFITELTLTNYFSEPKLWAGMYGFKGRFVCAQQSRNGNKLITFLRANKD